jgi:hypothetical protein
MSRLVLTLLLLSTVALLAACGDEIEVNNGLRSKLRIASGQYVDDGFPVDTRADAGVVAQTPVVDGGVLPPPRVSQVDSLNNSVKRGTAGKNLRVVVSQNARTVAIGLEGDPGYWVVPVAARSIEFAPDLELSASVDFDRSILLGPARVWFAASDESGHYGPARSLDLTILDDIPSAPFVVSLSWTANVDLDLVVVQPDGKVVTNKAVRSAADGPSAARIDLDSNAGCVLDGHRVENALFTQTPIGEYRVFVRQASACGVPTTGWTVRLLRDGTEVQRISGASYAYETDLPNGGPTGPGRFALMFTIGG